MNINFNNRLILVKKIVKDNPYENQKKTIEKLFSKTKHKDFDDIKLRLFVIDSCYSTQMNKRLFAFEALSDLILNLEEKSDLNTSIDVLSFVKKNQDLFKEKIGIDKKGSPKGHAFSLISKYFYYRTHFNFPIYDSLVFNELRLENQIKSPKKPSILYFEKLLEWKENFGITYDDLDMYFWVCGKVRSGSLSLLISNPKDYKNEFYDKLKLNENDWYDNDESYDNHEHPKKKKPFNSIVSDKLLSKDIKFDYPKLKDIQKLAKTIFKEKVFDKC